MSGIKASLARAEQAAKEHDARLRRHAHRRGGIQIRDIGEPIGAYSIKRQLFSGPSVAYFGLRLTR